jgi:pimeloyl-ACP methyl ester carboxylesterase
MSLAADDTGLAPGQAAGLRYLRRRDGRARRPLVLLHGIGSQASSYAPLMAAWPGPCDLLAWNAPGYGASQPLRTETPTPDDYADALVRMLDALDLDRVVLVGHSLGCLFAARLAARAPQRVAALALLSPALGYRVPAGEPLPPAVQARIDDLVRLGPAAFAAARAARLVHDPEHKPQVLAAVRAAMADVGPAPYAQAVHALGAGDLLADAPRIPAPTLVAVGAEDVVTPPANAHALAAALRPPVACQEIAGAGHALPQEDPAAVAALLTRFVEAADV